MKELQITNLPTAPAGSHFELRREPKIDNGIYANASNSRWILSLVIEGTEHSYSNHMASLSEEALRNRAFDLLVKYYEDQIDASLADGPKILVRRESIDV